MTRARPSTFSIVAFDPKTKDLGVAVESKFVAVGAVVPFAAARVGAVATQAYANTAYGRDALAMLKRGIAPKDVVKKLVTEDQPAVQRQVGVVDARGRAASYTGTECFSWAGHVVGRNFAAQGNILASEEVLKALARAFEVTQGDLPVRLLAALSAGQRAGGDKRGQQSAALLVVRQAGGYGGFNDRWIDIRVDDHPAPIEELIRIFNVYDLTLLTREDPRDVVVLKPNVVREIQAGLAALGLYRGPDTQRRDPLGGCERVAAEDYEIGELARLEGACLVLREAGVRASRGRGPNRVLRGDVLVLEESVHGPVDAEERPVRHAVGSEAQRDAGTQDLLERIVRRRPRFSEAAFVHVPRAAPLANEVRLARCHDARGACPPQDIRGG